MPTEIKLVLWILALVAIALSGRLITGLIGARETKPAVAEYVVDGKIVSVTNYPPVSTTAGLKTNDAPVVLTITKLGQFRGWVVIPAGSWISTTDTHATIDIQTIEEFAR